MIQESDVKRQFYINKLKVQDSEISNEDLNNKLEKEVQLAYLDGSQIDLMITPEDFDEFENEKS